MQRNANIEQTSEINKDFFVISQRVKQIFAVYCKYAKISKKSVFLQILLVSLQKYSPQSVPPERTFVLRQNFVIHYISMGYRVLNGRKKIFCIGK